MYQGGKTMYCKNCGKELPSENAEVCLQCGTIKGKGNRFCPNCGAPVNPGQDICLNCGIRLSSAQRPSTGTGGPKSKLTAGLFGIFWGQFGVHNFYLGYTTKAIIQVCVSGISILLSCCTAGLAFIGVLAMWIWGLVEGIMILTGHIDKDAQGNRLV